MISRIILIITLYLAFTFTSVHPVLNAGTNNVSQQIDPKYQSVLIFGIAKKIDWTLNESFNIGLLGNKGSLHTQLESIAEKQKIYGKPINVNKISMDRAHEMNIVFISSKNENKLESTLSSVEGNTLVITSFPGGIEAGSHINFTLRDNRIAFSLNKAALEKTQLKISSDLEKLAFRVLM